MSTERKLSDVLVKVVDASEFAEHSLELLQAVEAAEAEYYVMRDGCAVARLVPVPLPPGPPWGRYREVLKVTGDITSPIFTDAELDEFVEREMENINGTGSE